jgi:hypothetical protein
VKRYHEFTQGEIQDLLHNVRQEYGEEDRESIIEATEAFCHLMCQDPPEDFVEVCAMRKLKNNLKDKEMSVKEAIEIYTNDCLLLLMDEGGPIQ